MLTLELFKILTVHTSQLDSSDCTHLLGIDLAALLMINATLFITSSSDRDSEYDLPNYID